MSKPPSDNTAFRAAYEKGRKAARDGQPIDANPYPDHRTDRGSVTWSRAFWRYWRRGWEDERGKA